MIVAQGAFAAKRAADTAERLRKYSAKRAAERVTSEARAMLVGAGLQLALTYKDADPELVVLRAALRSLDAAIVELEKPVPAQ